MSLLSSRTTADIRSVIKRDLVATNIVYINLMIQVSYIQGHEIRIVSYALLDGGNCRFY